MKSMKTRRRFVNIIIYVVLSILAIVWIMPIIWLLITSFRQEPGAFVTYVIPKQFTLDNYILLFTDTTLFNYPRWFMNTLFVASVSCVITTILTLMTSYAFSRLRFRLRRPMMNVLLVLGMFPGFMSMVAIYHLLKTIGLNQSLWALILVYSGGAAMGYYISKGFFDTIPKAIDESAMLDGATRNQIFWRITLPLSRPIVIYTALTAFIAPWMDFIFVSVIMRDNYQNYTIALGLYQMITRENIYRYFTRFAAGSVLIAIPITILFIWMQRYYVEGLPVVRSKVNLLLIALLILAGCTKKQTYPETVDRSVAYEIFTGSYADSDGDGMGDLNGITSQVAYLTELGVGTIWLTPIMPSPSYHKYDVTDYKNVDPDFGTLEDYQTLISTMHDAGIRVILDLVLNHTSNQHPWFTAAKQAINDGTCAQPMSTCDYYQFSTEGGAGRYRATMDRYYEGSFGDHMPDLNLDAPAVRTEIESIVGFWLDLGTDGFRLDATTYYYGGNTAKNTEFLHWLNGVILEKQPNAYVVAEAWTDAQTIVDLSASGIESLFWFPDSESTGMIMKSLRSGKGAQLATDTSLALTQLRAENTRAELAVFLSNHDQGRSGAWFANRTEWQKLAASIYLLMPGIPFIYYGEEIGMTGSGVDPNKRLPMVWSSKKTTGMTLNPEGATQNNNLDAGVAEQWKQKDSLLRHYQEVLTIRNGYDVFVGGTVETVETPDSVYGMKLSKGETSVIILHNFSEQQVSVTLTQDVARSYGIDNGGGMPVLEDDIVTLKAYSSILIECTR